MSSSRSSTSNDPGVIVQSLLVVTDKKFARKLAFTFFAGIVVALFIGVTGYLTIAQLTQLRNIGVRSHKLVVALDQLSNTAENTVSSQRGYIITGKQSYLIQFRNGQESLPRQIDTLRSLGQPEEASAIQSLSANVTALVSQLNQTIEIRNSSGSQAAIAVEMSGEDELNIVQVQAGLAALQVNENTEFDRLVEKRNALFQRMLLLLTLLLAFEVLLFLGVLLMITRDRAERQANARVLSAQNERLRNQRDNLNFANDHLEVAFKRFQSLFQGVPVACVCTGPRGEILEWNRASELLFGFTIAEATRSTIYETVIRPSGLANAKSMAEAVMSGESFENFEWTCRTRSGKEIEVMSNSMPLVGEDGIPIGVMTATINMTERKAVERLKSEFVSTVSHELRTPLTSIRGALGLVCSGSVGVLPEQAKRLCEIANNNTERLVRLINDILDIEKIEAGNLAFSLIDCSLADLTKSTVDAIRSYADQFDIRVEITGDDEGAKVSGDPDRITQVLHNLLSNAIKFSRPGGKVLVDLQVDGENVRVSVRDFGAGIPDEFKPRIFGKFAQADSADTRQKGGTG